jgi:hypothetical protein
VSETQNTHSGNEKCVQNLRQIFRTKDISWNAMLKYRNVLITGIAVSVGSDRLRLTCVHSKVRTRLRFSSDAVVHDFLRPGISVTTRGRSSHTAAGPTSSTCEHEGHIEGGNFCFAKIRQGFSESLFRFIYCSYTGT